MLIHTETSLRNFQFWGGGADTAKYLSFSQLDTIENILEDIYISSISTTDLNDLFWFEADLLAEWLGYTDFEELQKDSVPWD